MGHCQLCGKFCDIEYALREIVLFDVEFGQPILKDKKPIKACGSCRRAIDRQIRDL